jgi:peptidoglycan hydrolase-like amidase
LKLTACSFALSGTLLSLQLLARGTVAICRGDGRGCGLSRFGAQDSDDDGVNGSV